VMTTDTNDGPCMWPGSRVEDIPINTDNGGYNIIERDGYYAALNRDRDTLYVSEDGFLTNDEIPLPQDLIGDYYPGLDFFYVAGSLYIALYATGGVVVYDVSEGVFSNKTGNLGSLLPLNGYNKYTANGITVKDSDEVPEP